MKTNTGKSREKRQEEERKVQGTPDTSDWVQY